MYEKFGQLTETLKEISTTSIYRFSKGFKDWTWTCQPIWDPYPNISLLPSFDQIERMLRHVDYYICKKIDDDTALINEDMLIPQEIRDQMTLTNWTSFSKLIPLVEQAREMLEEYKLYLLSQKLKLPQTAKTMGNLELFDFNLIRETKSQLPSLTQLCFNKTSELMNGILAPFHEKEWEKFKEAQSKSLSDEKPSSSPSLV